jgi:hypothetical protein
LEGLEISIGIVGDALFPTGEEDPDPFKGHCPYSGMVTFAAIALGLVTGLGPRAVTDGALTELVESLAKELWAGLAAVNTGVFAGLFSAGDAYRSNAAQIQQIADHFEPAAVGTEGRRQSWSQCRPGSRQILKEESIRMRAEEFSDPPFVLGDERQKTFELLGQQFHSQGGGSNNGEVSSQGLGFFDERQTLEDFLRSLAGETFCNSAKVGHCTSRSAARAVVISFWRIWRARGK